MEKRGFVKRTQYGADGRRAGIGLTAEGRRAAQSAILVHAGNIRRHFLDSLTPEQASVIRAWSEQAVNGLEPRRGEGVGDGASWFARELSGHPVQTVHRRAADVLHIARTGFALPGETCARHTETSRHPPGMTVRRSCTRVISTSRYLPRRAAAARTGKGCKGYLT
ncbi:hypothetical protein QF026_002271 [Streptomyces aurantiacus]|nr:hypothetical protein [Streptomyces aurantiacus]